MNNEVFLWINEGKRRQVELECHTTAFIRLLIYSARRGTPLSVMDTACRRRATTSFGDTPARIFNTKHRYAGCTRGLPSGSRRGQHLGESTQSKD